MKRIFAFFICFWVAIIFIGCKNTDYLVNSGNYIEKNNIEGKTLIEYLNENNDFSFKNTCEIKIEHNNRNYEIINCKFEYINNILEYFNDCIVVNKNNLSNNFEEHYYISLSTNTDVFSFYVYDDTIKISDKNNKDMFLYKAGLFKEFENLLLPIIKECDQFYTVEYLPGQFIYKYEIFDIKGNTIVSDTFTRQPHISLRENNVICMWTQAGTGSLVRGTDFYDTNTGKKSHHYGGIVVNHNYIVANSTSESVVISDMFSGKVLQVIDGFGKETYDGIEPIGDIKFVENGNKIRITYLTKDYNYTIETLNVDTMQQMENDNRLLSIMKNKAMLIDEKGNQTYFSEYNLGLSQPFEVQPEKYVIFDLDNDGENELIVGIKYSDHFVILDNDDGKIFGHTMLLRAFNMLNTNGEFIQSGGAGYNNIARIEFDKTKVNVINIAESNDYEGIYKIYGEPVSKDIVDNSFDAFYKSQQCEWILVE